MNSWIKFYVLFDETFCCISHFYHNSHQKLIASTLGPAGTTCGNGTSISPLHGVTISSPLSTRTLIIHELEPIIKSYYLSI